MNISNKLDKIENRIRSFVESNFLRGFNSQQRIKAENITYLLIDAMKSGIKPSGDAHKQIAPDIYTIKLRTKAKPELPLTRSFLNELAFTLETEGRKAGLLFNAPVKIRLEENTNTNTAPIIIESTISEINIGETEPINIQEPTPNNPTIKTFLINRDNQTIPLTKRIINIGRHPKNDLVIDDPHISRFHAQMRVRHGHHILFDLNSKGGTFVNNHKITEHYLKQGDVVSFSTVSFVYGIESANTIQETKEYKLKDIIKNESKDTTAQPPEEQKP